MMGDEDMTRCDRRRRAGRRVGTVSAISLLSLTVGAFEVHADEEGSPAIGYPYLKGEVSIELHYDNAYKADDPDAEVSDAFTKTEVALGAYFNRYLSLQSTLVFEPVLDPGPGEDRFFSDHGLYAEELYAKLDLSSFAVSVGKFNPAFGKAWDVTPGVYGTDLAEDYELTERIGAAIEFTKDGTPIGNLTLTAGAFYADTSELSDSIFTERGKLSRSDGGLSNTGNPDSFAIALAGTHLPGLAGVSYNLGFVHQSGSADDIDDQNGVVAGLQVERKLGSVGLELFTEAAYFDYAGDFFETGNPAEFVETLWYYTAGAKAKFDKYNVALAYTARNSELFNGTEFDDYQIQLSAGMELPEGWTVDAGYKFLEEQNQESHVVGLLFAKTIEFNTGALEPATLK